jgi:hypothetical protein
MPDRYLSYTGSAAADMGSVVIKPGSPNAYTQTYSTAGRTHAAAALSTSITISLLTEVAGQMNTTNAAVNELKKVVNALIDDLQETGIIS